MHRKLALAALLLALIGLLLIEFGPGLGNRESHARGTGDTFSENTEYQQIRAEAIVRGLEHPWAVAFLPDGRMLVTERPGRLKVIENGEAHEVEGLPAVRARGQGGLLDVVLHPRWDENGWIYFTFSKPGSRSGQTAVALARARLDGRTLEDVEEIFVQDRYSSAGRHYGSRLAWMPDGTLLMSIGDRGSDPPRAQDRRDHAGTLIRLQDDGSVPDDNPFVGDETTLDEIWSWGHRNIQGLVVDARDGTVWATEHGPRGGDILHRVQRGENHGWPVVTQGLDYRTQETFPDAQARRMEGVVPPFYSFGPTLAPSGLALVTTNRFRRWQDNLVAGGLRAERLRRLVVDAEEVLHDEELLLQRIGRIRDVRMGPDDNLWVLTDASDGVLWRISPVR